MVIVDEANGIELKKYCTFYFFCSPLYLTNNFQFGSDFDLCCDAYFYNNNYQSTVTLNLCF